MYAEFTTYGGGYTNSDSFLYLQKEQVIFLADLMHIGYHADFRQGNVDQWMSILKKVKNLNQKSRFWSWRNWNSKRFRRYDRLPLHDQTNCGRLGATWGYY